MTDSDGRDLQAHLIEQDGLGWRHREEMKLLDVIALCLTTGQSHDIVAVAFDKRHILTIALSKNHATSVADREQASLFFNALSDPNNNRPIDIIAVIATYSGMNMNKRVRKVAESLNNARTHITALLDQYNAGSRDTEFHPRDPVLSFELDVRESLQRALDKFSFSVKDFDINGPGGRLDPIMMFVAASQAAYYLMKTRFIQSEAEKPTGLPSFQTFQRRLAKLAQYSRGIRRLFTYRDRLSGQIPPFRWIDFPLDDPRSVKISQSPLDVAFRVMEINPASTEYGDLFWQCYPVPIEHWITTVTPTFHAEMRLILSLDSNQESIDSVRPIGCSKRSCLCCWHWINFYNVAHGTQWMTASSHGKPYMNWGLSGDILVDREVVAAMRLRVCDVLEWMKGWKRLPSDGHASSSGSSPYPEDQEGEIDIELEALYAGGD
ncbi:hypothetical protein A0H81_05380 [Grifola frondosa]|uniref:Uncharacterized protein n=1 Tax=Grifola frondosa TaxID=5627 RepID=A0A1C7MC55_GRIFR|nr:hypothetical protein A0H81_05380 [Grifola frondosa]